MGSNNALVLILSELKKDKFQEVLLNLLASKEGIDLNIFDLISKSERECIRDLVANNCNKDEALYNYLPEIQKVLASKEWLIAEINRILQFVLKVSSAKDYADLALKVRELFSIKIVFIGKRINCSVNGREVNEDEAAVCAEMFSNSIFHKFYGKQVKGQRQLMESFLTVNILIMISTTREDGELMFYLREIKQSKVQYDSENNKLRIVEVESELVRECLILKHYKFEKTKDIFAEQFLSAIGLDWNVIHTSSRTWQDMIFDKRLYSTVSFHIPRGTKIKGYVLKDINEYLQTKIVDLK